MAAPTGDFTEYEAQVLPGLAPFAIAELEAAGAKVAGAKAAGVAGAEAPKVTGTKGAKVAGAKGHKGAKGARAAGTKAARAANEFRAARGEANGDDAVRFTFKGDPSRLDRLRRAVAVFEVVRFDVPRPKALLGHAHLSRLLEVLARLRKRREYRGFRFAAAGSDSPVFLRLAEALKQETGLQFDPEEGELLLRVRPGSSGGWEVLARLTPRPLAARWWRECNRPGGLNATVAVAALDMLGGSDNDAHLNLMCGSGTLLIERALAGPWRRGAGVDIDPAAIACAQQNVTAAKLTDRPELLVGDATSLPFGAGEWDAVTVDLPWGDAVGEHESNRELYPKFLAEAARVTAKSGRMLAITHELRLFESVLAGQSDWRVERQARVFHGGHRPGLFLLTRSRHGGVR